MCHHLPCSKILHSFHHFQSGSTCHFEMHFPGTDPSKRLVYQLKNCSHLPNFLPTLRGLKYLADCMSRRGLHHFFCKLRRTLLIKHPSIKCKLSCFYFFCFCGKHIPFFGKGKCKKIDKNRCFL